ncbi:NAD-dependent epimerase [Vagococcus lutrae]|uniref:NAD-dependent epimerase n=1 Tax=Vagococcus lutrae TaxID=81947 RepID=UPI00288E3F31|nr:NAD-dependent epimerase [Vagococcus lutrae]MDT2808524.1 NAD-dependent epimerase [Vagococcus lutrae]
MKILITGAAGFIGASLSKKILEDTNFNIIGIDNLNDYYDVQLKHDRLKKIEKYDNFKFKKIDLVDKLSINNLFATENFDVVINLAAQAGVRYSIENPQAYVDSNLIGFMNLLEACRNNPVKHLIYASSSSVYGGNTKIPFSTEDNVDHPVSLYAATKKSNELLAHSYSHLYKIPTTGLRFFTVYGPYGRPDMAYYSFTKNIIEGNPIKVFNNGDMERDFTYIDDIVEGIYRLIDSPPQSNNQWNEYNGVSSSFAPYKIYNIGNNQPVSLMKFINIIEKNVGKKANKIFIGMQAGDVKQTYADISDLKKAVDFQPSTSLDKGIEKFVKWYKEYYEV